MSDENQPATDVVLKLERINCPLCGLSDSSVVMTLKDNLCGIPGEFHLERCYGCGHRFMNPRPCLESLADCYPQQYGPHQSAPNVASGAAGLDSTNQAAKEMVKPGRPLYQRILPLRYIPGLKQFYNRLIDDRGQLVPQASALSPADKAHAEETTESRYTPRALEIGCATGEYLIRLQAAGWKTTGIEPGVRPAGIASERGLDVHCGNLETSQLKPASFELAAAWMVIEHVPDPRDTLQRIHALLKPGGHLLFSIPNAGGWEAAFFGSMWYALELPRHLHQFTPTSIRTLLKQSGYGEISITHQRNLSNVLGSIGQLMISRWPESRFGRWLLNYPHRPTVGIKLILAPWAHVIAWMGQGGRLTISAKRYSQPESALANSNEHRTSRNQK
jgi:SAM-dependent methyltransferase